MYKLIRKKRMGHQILAIFFTFLIFWVIKRNVQDLI